MSRDNLNSVSLHTQPNSDWQGRFGLTLSMSNGNLAGGCPRTSFVVATGFAMSVDSISLTTPPTICGYVHDGTAKVSAMQPAGLGQVEPRSASDDGGSERQAADLVEMAQMVVTAKPAGTYDDADDSSKPVSLDANTLRSTIERNQYTGSNFNNWNIGNGKSQHSQPQGLPPDQTRYRPRAKIKPKSSEDEGGTTAS